MEHKLLAALTWRYATQAFDTTKKLTQQELNILLECIRLTPSSLGLQPWKFIVIQNQELKNQLVAINPNNPQIGTCSHLIIFCCSKNISAEYISEYINNLANYRGVSLESLEQYKNSLLSNVKRKSTPEELILWTSKQCYIALGVLLTSAALLNIDACPMEGINCAEYDKILGLESDYTTQCACALGFRNLDDVRSKSEKFRFPLDKIFEYK